MRGAAGHRVLDVLDRCDGRAGVHERVILHHALVHAVEGDVVAVRGDVLAFVDAPLAAVHRFAEHDVLTRVGTEQHGFEAIQRTLHEYAFVVLDDKHLMLDVLVDDIVPIDFVECCCGDFAFQNVYGFVVAREVEGVGVEPFVAVRTGNLVRFLRCGGEEDSLFAAFGVHQHDVLVVVDVRILVSARLPSDATDVVDDIAFGEINGLAEERGQEHRAEDAQQ